MKTKKMMVIIVAANMAIGLSAFADNTSNRENHRKQNYNNKAGNDGRADRQSRAEKEMPFTVDSFLKDAAAGGMAEINMAQIGTQRASDPELKDISQKLVRDHSKMDNQVKELAEKKNVTLPTEVDTKHKGMIDHISNLSGAAFDHAYTMQMVQGHKKTIAKFEQAAANTEDSDVRDFAKQSLPTLKHHLAMLEKSMPARNAGVRVDEAAGAQPTDDKPSNEATHKVDEAQSPK